MERRYRPEVVGRLSAVDKLSTAVDHLNRGKATRARCVQLVGEAFSALGAHADDAGGSLDRFAEAVELLHLGTLIHDDILDEAEIRRGRPSVHVAFGTKVAVLAGDVAVSRSGCIIARFGISRLSLKFAETLAELCEGELLQDDQRWNPHLTFPSYLDRLAAKTGSLFELACEGAALLAGASDAKADRAARFGRDLGCLFQMVDDLLDATQDAAQLGKASGQDLAAGCLTLTAVVGLEDPDLGPQLRAQLSELPGALDLSAMSGLLADPRLARRAGDLVEAMGQTALEDLQEFPPGDATAQLRELAMGLLAVGRTALLAQEAVSP